MSRLIDADKLIELFTRDKELLQRGLGIDSKFAYMTADYVIKQIMNQLTAYDVDKVAKALEEFRDEATQFGIGGMVSDMVDVVRKGGVE